MIVSRRVQFLVVACVLASLPAYAKQSEPAKRQLKFEVSTTPVELTYRFPEAKYVAYFHVKADRKLESWLYGVRDMPQGKEMSEEQRRFIHKLEHNYEYGRHATRMDKGNPFQGTIIAQVSTHRNRVTRSSSDMVDKSSSMVKVPGLSTSPPTSTDQGRSLNPPTLFQTVSFSAENS